MVGPASEPRRFSQHDGDETVVMSFWKPIALGTYYYATSPLRYFRNRMMSVAGRAPIAILMYHRVADDAANEWTTRNDVFAREIQWLQKRFEIISLSEAQQRLRKPYNYRPAICITFDDGYAANCDQALPLLVDQGIPFTYFVTSSAVLAGRYFQHDLEMGNRLEPNNLEQLKSLAQAGVEIGAHTRSHADLNSLKDEAELYDEIVTSGRDLEKALGHRVRYFAFPFGQHANLNARGFQMAASAGYEAVVSAYGGYNFPGDDAFHLQRLGVDDSMLRMKNCTTLDPYKQWKINRFVYGPRKQDANEAARAPAEGFKYEVDDSGGKYAR